jgi:adenine-specific DNA-methyltransferase
MEKRGRLELTWVGKYEEEKLEPRILVEDKSKSYGDRNTENMLIHGDNLLALKALEKDYAGKVKCIYIDPPYNTGSAFEHYDDGLEHSVWLSMMKIRLEILRNLLSDNGFIFAQIDNYEMAYLKVLMDEVFGRNNFVNDIVWKRKGGSVNPRNKLNNNTDYILWYAKNENAEIYPVFTIDDPETQEYIRSRFTHQDEKGRKYRLSPIISPTYSKSLVYEYKGYQPPKNGWSLSLEKMQQFEAEGRLYMPENKTQRIQRKQFLDEYQGRPIGNLWTDINVINPMSIERMDFIGQKPEVLIKRVLELSTKEGDLVIDSFLGSGTTMAVAHKMRRRWIGIEMRDQAYSHCKVRIDSIIDGDQGGISKDVKWQGGGGYKFYELAEPLLVKHPKLPVYQLNPNYSWNMVCEAICKIEGFTYSPIGDFNGHSSENRFIHITDEFVNSKYVMNLTKALGERQSVLIYCTKNQADMMLPVNVEIKKIPKDLLSKCSFKSEVEA